MRPVRAVTLDAYGTVFEFEDRLAGVARDIFELLGMPAVCPHGFARAWGRRFHELYESFGRSWRREQLDFKTIEDLTVESLGSLYRELGIAADPAAGAAVWIEHLLAVEPYVEVSGVLAKLARRCRLAIISDTDERIIAPALERLAGPFEFVLTSEGARAYKYDPEARLFRLALERLALVGEEVLHVGDSPADVAGAKLAGMRAAWVNRHARALPDDCPRPDWEIEDLSSLPALLGAPA